jgi:hypothetical protein
MIRCFSSRSHRVLRLWLQQSQASDLSPASSALTGRNLYLVSPKNYMMINGRAAFSTNTRAVDVISRSHSLVEETSVFMKQQSFSDPPALALVNKWNTAIKELQTIYNKSHEQETVDVKKTLFISVQAVYLLLNHIRQSKTAGAQLQAVALTTTLQALARVSEQDPDIAPRAQKLLDQYAFSNPPLTPEHGQLTYNAVLIAWAHSTRPDAPDRIVQVLHTLKQQQGFVDHQLLISAYNRAMGAFAKRGHVKGIALLWTDMLAIKLQPNRQSYVSFFRAYKVQFDKERIVPNLQQRNYTPMELLFNELAFYSQLQPPRDDSYQPHFSHVDMVLQLHLDDTSACRRVLDQVLNFERACQCRGLLINERVLKTLFACFKDEAMNGGRDLVRQMLASDHLQVGTTYIDILMKEYAAQNTVEGLRQVESMVFSLEEHALSDGAPYSLKARNFLDQAKYHVLLKAYLSVNLPDAVDCIRTAIDRQSKAAKRLREPALRPGIVAYTTYQAALVKSGRPGFAQEVQRIFEMILSSSRLRNSVNDAVFHVAIRAWMNSNVEDADERAETIFNRIPEPTQTSVKMMLKLYVDRGHPEKAIALVKRMRSLAPGQVGGAHVPTYYQVLEAIHGSESQTQWTDATTVFDEIVKNYKQGDKSCFPNHAMVTMTILFQMLRNCDAIKFKHTEADKVLRVLSSFGFVLDRQNFTILTKACTAVQGSEEDKQQAFAFLLQTFDTLRNKSQVLDWKLFDAMLVAAGTLLEDGPTKNESVGRVFQLCAEAGHVAFQIVETVRKLCPPDVYATLIGQPADERPNYDAIPIEWKRNCPAWVKR